MKNFKIETATFAEMDFIINCAREEGWNPGLYDKEAFYAADPGGFFIAKLDNKPVGCISAVKYEGNFGFVGLFIVLPEYRNHGYGSKLQEQMLQYLKGCNIGRDAVPTNQERGKRQGAKYFYANKRYEGTASIKAPKDSAITELSKVAFDDLLKYDTRIFGIERKKFLEKWINQPKSFSYAYLDEKKNIKGYGLLRKCFKGYKIGPLFAGNSQIADIIYRHLLQNISGENFYFDIPMINQGAVNMVRKYNLEAVFETARMYIGSPLQSNVDQVFGVTTFELG